MDTNSNYSAIAKQALLGMLILLAVWFSITWFLHLRKHRERRGYPSLKLLLIGFITDFLDTLGVGSFATTTSFYKLGKMVDDELIPGTLNVGHTLPTILQALIYIQVVEVDIWTLVALIVAAVVGSYAGASIVSRLPKHLVQYCVGFALLAAAGLVACKVLGWIPSDGDSLVLLGWRLAAGILANAVFGALMTIGIGAYAPIMITVSLLGMNQKAAFPIMMGACAFLMPAASYRFIRSDKYDSKAALGLTLLGLPGVAIAAFLVKEMNTYYLNILVVVVVLYTAISMLRSARAGRAQVSTNPQSSAN